MKATVILIAAAMGLGPALLCAQNQSPSAPGVAGSVAPNAVSSAQSRPQFASRTAENPSDDSASGAGDNLVTVPSGTKVPLTLKQGITTKNARVGDPVYAQTSFPITMNDHIVIPPGTFVQGEVLRVLRPGRVKGRAELQMNFTSMIFPNGYTVMLPGAVQGTPGDPNTAGVKGKEGTIQGDGGKGKDVGTIVGSTIPGAGIGAIADGSKGAAIGGASGAALGLATVLLTRGPEIQLGPGDSIEMVLERSITLDQTKAHRATQ